MSTATEILLRQRAAQAAMQEDMAWFRAFGLRALEDLRYHILVRVYWRHWLFTQANQLLLTYTPKA